jgi:malonyl-CoA O-methyltransferase
VVRRGDPHLRRNSRVTGYRATVAQAFAGAHGYDEHARVQRAVAQGLARRIAALPLPTAPRTLEIGCGTGFLTQALCEHGLAGDWLITDLAPEMLDRARARLQPLRAPGPAPRLTFAQLDGEHGTPQGGPFDLICASLATQWFASEPAALNRWRQWLAPGGQIMVATLGPGTFARWRAAHAAEGLEPGTLRFTPPETLAALHPAELLVERHQEHHADARAFLRSVRGIGAGTAAPGHKPLSAAALRRVMQRFEAEGAIATYEVVTCRLERATGPA